MELTTAMLADNARIADGKLYIFGGQWDRLTVSRLPAKHPTMTVVLVVRVEYNEAPVTFPISVDLVLDGRSAGARANGQLSVGHAPGLKHGAPQFASVAATFNEVSFEKAGRYEFIVSAGGRELGHIPLEVVTGMTVNLSGGPVPSAGPASPDEPAL